MLLLLSLALFAAALALPAIPALRETLRPRDDGRLHIAEEYVRDPRWFGTAYRRKLAPFVAAAHGPSFSTNVQLRTEEETRWAPDLAIAPGERVRGIAVGDRIVVGSGAGIRDAYALESLVCEPEVVARTLTSDGTLAIGANATILRWIDADGAVEVGAGTNLGVSASGGETVRLGAGVCFQRVWGRPVSTLSAATAPFELPHVHGTPVLTQAGVPAAAPLTVFGDLRIERGTHVTGSLKVHGALSVEAGATFAGTVIARGDVTFAADVTVLGHLFSEADIRLGPGCRVGRSGGVKTVYAAGRAWLANDVEIAGWLVAEDGGETL
jgi:cytoskeletal protein CcmA (bactofilin family)